MIENKIIDMHIHVDGRMDVSILIGTELWLGTIEKDLLETQCYWKNKEEEALQESRDIRKVFRFQLNTLIAESDEDKQKAIINSIRALLRMQSDMGGPRLNYEIDKTIEKLTIWLDGFGDDI